ncbi:ecto-NOX disulfide-thiol exchanger 2-like [Scyliorhinus canicula]|uniref:ecto-NOX disulfide-thiol exchanger 2-like n=1 Tax=Scyliorhinus canicula TaxID=7830 RepID=UPI0018F6FE86|nr:ecto-NOX disulfide-thiol exchanger 2-like [Scyliorhinus canicula]
MEQLAFDNRCHRMPGHGQLPYDPANNDEPIQFDSSNGPLMSECSIDRFDDPMKKRRRNNIAADGFKNLALDHSPLGMSLSDSTTWGTAMNNLGMGPMGMTGQPLMSEFDRGLRMMTGIGPMNPIMPGLEFPPGIHPDMLVIKEIIHCKSCTLFPPNPNLPPPAMRDRPPGCKTVFVGGLPENGSEDMITDVFGQCGEIIAIRKSKKNFCHIRFSDEYMIDKALFLSGYRIRIGSSTDKKDTGRLHVDFAQARDDLYEWECKQRMLAREERHRRRVAEDRFRLPSPPPIVHYSEHESAMLSEKLVDDAKFSEAVQTLYTWLERGEVNRRSANIFYSMIQSANSHIRRLMNEKILHQKEMEEAKEKFKNALSGILVQFEQIVSVFQSSSKQKAWDHFSKAQRKNLHMWRKQAEEIRNIHNDELMSIRREEEMEMSDDDMEEMPENKITDEAAQAEALKQENDSLRWQLDAYRNEVELLKQEQGKLYPTEEETTKDQQLKLLQQTLQGMQQQLLNLREDCKKKESEFQKAKEEKQKAELLLETLKGKEKLDHNRRERAQTGVPYIKVLTPFEERALEVAGMAGDRSVTSIEIGLRAEVDNYRPQPEGQSHEDSAGRQDIEESNNQGNNNRDCIILSSSQEKDGELDRVITGPVRSEREALLVGIISTFLHVHPFGASIDYICSYLQRLDAKISPSEIEGLLTRLQHVFQQEITGVGASLEKRWKFNGFDGIKALQN